MRHGDARRIHSLLLFLAGGLVSCSCPPDGAPHSIARLELKKGTPLDENGAYVEPVWAGTSGAADRLDPRADCKGDPDACGVAKSQVDIKKRIWPICRDSVTEHPGGHWNFEAATYKGALHFSSFCTPPILDGDYDMYLTRDTPVPGVTTGAGGNHLGLEFNASETIDRFTTETWIKLRNRVEKAGVRKGELISSNAVVTGLFVLDCVHCYATELHPVYGLAFVPDRTGETVEDKTIVQTWLLFARNWGNEGECSGDLHDLDKTRLVFKLPWRQKSYRLAVDRRSCLRSAARLGPVEVVFVKDEEVTVAVPLEDALNQTRVSGELVLRWIPPGAAIDAPAEVQACSPASAPAVARGLEPTMTFAEFQRRVNDSSRPDSKERLMKQLRKLKPDELREYYDEQTFRLSRSLGPSRADEDDTQGLRIAFREGTTTARGLADRPAEIRRRADPRLEAWEEEKARRAREPVSR